MRKLVFYTELCKKIGILTKEELEAILKMNHICSKNSTFEKRGKYH